MVQEQITAAYLVIENGPQAGKRIEICKDYTTIGRSRECDIFLEDVAVHRKQASIMYNEAGYAPRDENSRGGSVPNGRSVKKKLLRDGGKLLFCDKQLTIL